MLAIRIDANPVFRAVSRVYVALRRRIPKVMDEAGEAIADHAKFHHRYRDRTGELTRSIHSEGARGDLFSEGVFVDVVADAPHAGAIEYGSRAHKIRAKRAKRLRFTGRDGRTVFAKEVNHPGTKPYRFLGNALDAGIPTTARLLEEEAGEAFKDAGFK